MRSLDGSKRGLVVAAVLAAAPIPLAFAQEAGSPEPAPSAATSAERQAGAASATAEPPAEGPTPPPAATPHVDAEGDDPDHQPAPPPPKPVPVTRTPAIVKDGMVRIPGGRFTMGSDDRKAPANERPSRIVVVPAFWIDKIEVTVGAYHACVERGACPRPARSSTSCTYDMGDPALPVSCVPWASAQAFCIAANKRLPREVEWEMAARGTLPIKYPWGGSSASGCGPAVTLASDRSQRSCGKNRPAHVGSHPNGASPFGVHDMSGNVEEWVADWYADAVSDLSPRAGASHVLRGGGWLSQPSQAKTTSRNWGSAREMGPNVGFRCAKDD